MRSSAEGEQYISLLLPFPSDAGQPKMFDPVAIRTQCDQSQQRLEALLVVIPSFVTLHRPQWPPPSTNFALMPCFPVTGSTKAIPLRFGDGRSDVVIPAGGGHKLNGEVRSFS